MGLFGTRRFLDEEDEAWQIESWRWMLREFGGMTALQRTPFVTPTSEFFPRGPEGGEARAQHVFEIVKRLANMDDETWPCRLIVQPTRPNPQVSQLGLLRPITSLPLGTFLVKGGIAEISYDPDNVADPIRMIATFAHELAHYRMHRASSEPPGGEDLHEYVTDLMVVFLGFGLFGANAAFNFGQFQGGGVQGWSTSGAGYISQRAWVFALAIFMQLRRQGVEEASQHLKDYLYTDLRTAWKYLASSKSPLAPLRTI